MNFEELVGYIGNLGFPIAVTIYLLARFERKIDTLETALNKLTHVLASKERN